MSVECQVNVKSQSELDIGGREKLVYIPVLANPGISELFLKAINCEVGVTFVLEEALAFIPQSN